jgi:LysR family transcriptional activator of nhaA
MINLNYLYAFFVSAEHLNFSKAASVLGISQPSLSQQIKNLEEQLGASLFLRNGKSVSLTSRGKDLQRSSSLFFDLQDEVAKVVEDKTALEDQPAARILVTDEIERPFVAEVVAKVAKKFKGKLEIFSSTTSEAFSKDNISKTDILLSHEKVETPWNYIKVDFPVFLVTSSAIPKLPAFDDAGNIQKVLDYFGEDLIIPASSIKLGREYLSFKKKYKLKKNVMMESNIISCLVRFVASGTGCSFLPSPYIKSSLYQNHLHLIGPREGYWKHSVYIYANDSVANLENHPLVKTIRSYSM